MTPNELEAYDAMIADRDRWRERAERLESLCPSGAVPCSPCMTNISRPEDMGGGSLLLFRQEDGDWIIRLVGRNLASSLVTCSIEFCTPMMGGGASPKTWEALEHLAQAMMEDNAAPQLFGFRAEHSQANDQVVATAPPMLDAEKT